jgi:hypothetical protein
MALEFSMALTRTVPMATLLGYASAVGGVLDEITSTSANGTGQPKVIKFPFLSLVTVAVFSLIFFLCKFGKRKSI